MWTGKGAWQCVTRLSSLHCSFGEDYSYEITVVPVALYFSELLVL